MTHRFIKGGVVLSCAAASLWAAGAQAGLIVQYKLDETGTTAASTGSNTTPLTMFKNNTQFDYHGEAGSGVSGGATDRALDFSSVDAMGNNSTTLDQPRARHLTNVTDLDALNSFTVTGWYKTSTQIDRYAHLVDNRNTNGGNTGFELTASGGTLILTVNGGTAANSTTGAFNDANKWVFFAVTYDGTKTTDNVTFYRGYRNDAERGSKAILTAVGTATLDKGATVTDTNLLIFGNSDAAARPFKGFMDDLRIYGVKDGSSDGVLTLTQLETVRSSAIPEPAAGAIGLVGSAGVLLARKRK